MTDKDNMMIGDGPKQTETCSCGCSSGDEDACTCSSDRHREHHDNKECICPDHHHHHDNSCGCSGHHHHDESTCCCDDDDDNDDCCCCCGEQKTAETDGLSDKQKKMLGRIIACAVLFVSLLLTPESFWNNLDSFADGLGNALKLSLYAIDYLIIGYDILIRSAKKIGKGNFMDENFLMAVATIGAIVLGLTGDGDFNEAVAVMLFYQIGEFFQSYAVGKSRRNITQLMDIRPDYAHIEKSGDLVKVDPSTLPIGSIVVVQPGEKVPIDGIIVDGSSSLDTSALTGESVPRNVNVGDDVVSGCMSMSGVLKVKTTKEFGESTVSKILDLVENASSRKAKSEDFIRKFAKIYTPCVCGAAAALCILPTLFLWATGTDPQFTTWLYRGLTFLVISCPCALVISIPLSFFAAIGGSSKNGVLVKGSNYIETLSKVKTIMFDKTGTLTKGKFEVAKVVVENEKLLESVEIFKNKPAPYLSKLFGDDMGDSKKTLANTLLQLAAHVECSSSHPIAKSLIEAAGDVDRKLVGNIEEIGGKGITAEVDSLKVAVGNAKLMNLVLIDSEKGPFEQSCKTSEIGTVVYVAIDGKYAGKIVVSDVIKDTSAEAIEKLHSIGVENCIMLTGDNKTTAEAVANELNLDEFHAELMPENKVERVERSIEAAHEKNFVAFVGDGINDAPVLMRADVGIAMGALGSDAAIEAADVVLMDDDPKKVSLAIRIARKSMRIVYENITFALAIKGICLVLGALGIANMYMAIFADVGVMILAILNAMRCLRAPRG